MSTASPGDVSERLADPERAYWSTLIQAGSPSELIASWLALQCRRIPDVRCAVVLLGPAGTGPYAPAGTWPVGLVSAEHLSEPAEKALIEREPVIIDVDGRHDIVHIGYPIEVKGALHGAVVLEADWRTPVQVQALLRELHWGLASVEVIFLRRAVDEDAETKRRVFDIVDLVAIAVEESDVQAACTAFATELATRLDCDRVSVGFVRGHRVALKAISHSANFGKRMNLVAALEAAMNECIDQGARVTYPVEESAARQITRCQEALIDAHGATEVCSVPIRTEQAYVGAMTLERSSRRPFSQPEQELAEGVASLAGPILELKRRDARWITTKIGASLLEQMRRLLGPRYVIRKLIGLLLITAAVYCSFATGAYRLTADTVIEGAGQRSAVAPFEGYIAQANARAGDVVKAGEVLCILNDRELQLERVRWTTQRAQLVNEQREAVAKRERAQAKILESQVSQADAQIELIDAKLERTVVTAPFDGLVVAGDLTQSLGAPVARGDVLFELAPLDEYRVILQVDEGDVADAALGQQGVLILSSLPAEQFGFVVSKITPVARSSEGRTYFRVEAELQTVGERVRPGMDGIGKIYVGERKLFWIWTEELWRQVRLWSWRWLP